MTVGTFTVQIEVGDPQGQRFERVEALVDAGSTFTVLPRSLLESLGVEAHAVAKFRIADERVIERPVGRTWIRIDGRSEMTLVVFGEEGATPLLGAYALEGMLLAPDPVGQRLVPVEALRFAA